MASEPGPTLRDLLAYVKDPLQAEKQSSVVYEVRCTCGTVYIGRNTLERSIRTHA